MYWVIATAVYGLGGSTVALWYGGASAKSRRHQGGTVSFTSLLGISARIFLIWWYLAPGAYFSRAISRKRAVREAL